MTEREKFRDGAGFISTSPCYSGSMTVLVHMETDMNMDSVSFKSADL